MANVIVHSGKWNDLLPNVGNQIYICKYSIADSKLKLSDGILGCGSPDLEVFLLLRRVEPSWLLPTQALPDSPSWPHLAAPTTSLASTYILPTKTWHYLLFPGQFYTRDSYAIYKSNFQPICFLQSFLNPILKLTRCPYNGDWQFSSLLFLRQETLLKVLQTEPLKI